MVIAQELTLSHNNKRISVGSVANNSAKVAVADVLSFIPGVSASLLAFIVFGTTKTFQDYFYRSLAPRSVGRRCRETMKTLSIVSTNPPRRRHSEPVRLGSASRHNHELGGNEHGAGMGSEDDLEIRCAGPSIMTPDRPLVDERRGRRGPAIYTNSVATW